MRSSTSVPICLTLFPYMDISLSLWGTLIGPVSYHTHEIGHETSHTAVIDHEQGSQFECLLNHSHHSHHVAYIWPSPTFAYFPCDVVVWPKCMPCCAFWSKKLHFFLVLMIMLSSKQGLISCFSSMILTTLLTLFFS